MDVARAIQADRYADTDNIYYENGEYFVSSDILIELPERVWVDTVGGYWKRHGPLKTTHRRNAEEGWG